MAVPLIWQAVASGLAQNQQMSNQNAASSDAKRSGMGDQIMQKRQGRMAAQESALPPRGNAMAIQDQVFNGIMQKYGGMAGSGGAGWSWSQLGGQR